MLSNINACLAVQDTVKTTLGPYGGDLLIVDANGRQTITNDGATVMKVSISFSYLLYLWELPVGYPDSLGTSENMR
jgi:hypothetical protein